MAASALMPFSSAVLKKLRRKHKELLLKKNNDFNRSLSQSMHPNLPVSAPCFTMWMNFFSFKDPIS